MFCTYCGSAIADGVQACGHCGAPLPAMPPPMPTESAGGPAVQNSPPGVVSEVIQIGSPQGGPAKLQITVQFRPGAVSPAQRTPAPSAAPASPSMAVAAAAAMAGAAVAVARRVPTNGAAVACLILGIFSLLLGPFTGIPAIICGHVARRTVRNSQGQIKGAGMALAGLILGYGMTLFFLLLVLVPSPHK